MSADPDLPIARSRVRIGVGAAAVVLVVALGCAVLFSALAPRGASSTVGTGSAPGGGLVDQPAASATPSGASLFVHILGAVNRPGLYELHDGARAVDAVAAAGGFGANADQSQLNLARFVSDGEQIVVPVLGETQAVGPESAAPGAQGVPGTAGAKVNINTADAATLETLPRVGPAMSARIIAWRETNGRFTAVEDLMSVTGIGEKTFEGFKDLVTL
jgi:competence protein ComEA